jgi:hypothetical protein
LVQAICVPEHGSVHVPPHCSGGHCVAGVQQVPCVPHCSPPVHWFEQVNLLPEHGSVHVPEHCVLGHAFAGAQHWPPGPQSWLVAQFPAQLTVVLLHVSGIVPQNPVWHLGAMQLWHVVALQYCPFAHVLPQSVVWLPHRFHTVPQ